ncbi:AEC family transporter [Mammaliicoccus sp. Dog046]|uniref:AEC family transporter n=1 Tax=Mammaliicoccus sp. Dog046 TaxID=3034233 RepID=UPI002B25C47A|nr:AEC family transporter [Mammaliicoccus sp. Dog046]WQK85664.1 AEC family transporter [Mammaliicoccus sp. Dog046]
MAEMFNILLTVVVPIFLMTALGYVLQKRVKLDLRTLAKLNINVFVPGFIFAKFYKSDLAVHLLFYIVIFFLIYIIILYIVALLTSKLQKLDKGKETTLMNSVLFFNSGNYGAPLNDIVFKSDPVAMSAQVIILTLQNVFTFTYGIFAIQSVQVGKLKALLNYFKMPIIYALVIAIILNYNHIAIPGFLWTTVSYLSDAMIAVALILLGAQIANIKLRFKWSSSYIYIVIRLVVGPAIAFVIIKCMGLDGIIAQTLFIASAMPTSVNSSVIAQEYDNYPELAAELVFLSTLFSSITVVVVIHFSHILF